MSDDNTLKMPTTEQWKRLYEAADQLKGMRPWEHLFDDDIISIRMQNADQPLYCTVMGRHEMAYGIALYPGNDALRRFYLLTNAPEGQPGFISMFQQKALMCYFGEEEQLDRPDQQILEELGLSYSGTHQFTYFRALRPGLVPWLLTDQEALIFTKILTHLIKVCEALASGAVKADYENGEMIERFYSSVAEKWVVQAVKAKPFAVELPSVPVEDEALLAELRGCPKTDKTFEFDLPFLPTPIRETKEEIPWLPQLALMADAELKVMLGHRVLDAVDDVGSAVLDLFTQAVREQGIPAKVLTRDEWFSGFVADLCAKLGVEIVQGERLVSIDDYLLSMLDFMKEDMKED